MLKVSIKQFCIAALLFVSILLFSGTLFAHNHFVGKTLTILNWAEYIDPKAVKGFEERYGVKVKEVYFGSDDLRNQMLLDSGGKGYDLVMTNGASLSTYSHLGWLSPIPKETISNLKFIDNKWVKPFQAAREYGVPYFWGTLGIAYRSDKIDYPVESWVQLMSPDNALKGRILMNEDSTELISAALKALGYSLNSEDSQELDEAGDLLLRQNAYVKEYASLSLGEDSSLVTGDIWMAMTYSGDALMVQEYSEAIKYVVPKEGGGIWIDYLAVLASSDNKDLAYEFLNYLNDPVINAKNAQFVYYATPNKAAETLLPADFLADPIIYPSQKALANSEFFKVLPPRVKRKRNNIFARILK